MRARWTASHRRAGGTVDGAAQARRIHIRTCCRDLPSCRRILAAAADSRQSSARRRPPRHHSVGSRRPGEITHCGGGGGLTACGLTRICCSARDPLHDGRSAAARCGCDAARLRGRLTTSPPARRCDAGPARASARFLPLEARDVEQIVDEVIQRWAPRRSLLVAPAVGLRAVRLPQKQTLLADDRGQRGRARDSPWQDSDFSSSRRRNFRSPARARAPRDPFRILADHSPVIDQHRTAVSARTPPPPPPPASRRPPGPLGRRHVPVQTDGARTPMRGHQQNTRPGAPAAGPRRPIATTISVATRAPETARTGLASW